MNAASGTERAGRRGGPLDMTAAVLAGSVGPLAVSLVSALAVQMRASLHFSATALGVGVALYFLGAAIGSVPLAAVSERVGGIRVMRVSGLVSVLALGLLATAASWTMLAAILLLAGMSSSAMQPAINLFLARRMPQGRQGLAFGVKQAAIPLATLLAGLAVPAIALTVGWRWAFAAAAALALAAVAVIPRPSATAAARRRAPAPQAASTPVVPLLILTAGFGLGIAAATGLSAFLVVSAVGAGMAKGSAGLLAALAGGVAMATRVGVGAAADRRGGRHFPVVAKLLAVGTAGYAILTVGSATRLTWIFALGTVVALGAGWGFNGLFNFAVVDAQRHAPARATGFTAVGGRLGGVAGPLAVGIVADHASYAAAWGLDAAIALSAAVTIALGSRALARRSQAPEPPGGPRLGAAGAGRRGPAPAPPR